jgi:hypothetical protein
MIFLLFLLLAQDPQVLIIKAGEVAPFDGFVMREDRFVKILEQDVSIQILQVELEMKEKLQKKTEEIYLKELEKKTEKHWWESPHFNQVLGFVAGAICSTTIYLAVR